MREEALKKVREFFEGAVQAPAYQKWREEAREAWMFYDGQQWSDEEVRKLRENAQPTIVINKIAAKVDNIAGTEVSGRTRILYRSRSGSVSEEKTARAISDLALFVAERNEQAIELSNVFRSGLVTGLGWLDVGVENAEEGPLIFNRCEDELTVVWDALSRRLDFSDARFVCRERWLDEEEVKLLFPEKAGDVLQNLERGRYIPLKNGLTGPGINYVDPQGRQMRIVEVQYKQTEKRYTVQHADGNETVTFERREAYSVPDAQVTSTFASRVYVAYFTENILLSHGPMPYNHNQFSLVPYVFKRNRLDGRPYGLVRSAIDPQRELNKRRSKAMHLLNTAQVIADIDAVEDPAILAREAARPDGMILKRSGKELRIIRNTDLAQSQVGVMEQAARDIQEVMGVFDESIGRQSNATSGIAIQQRQIAGSLNQMFAFDALRRAKRTLGMQILSLIRQYFTHEMVIQLTDNFEAARLIKLNSREILPDGTEVVLNDVRSGVFDIHVEEVRDVLSSREFEVQQLNMLIQAGVPVPPQLLVEATSLKNKEEILRGMNEAAGRTTGEEKQTGE
jgi:hypothetical protein